MLATAVTDRPFEWEEHLRRLCFTYNTSVHPTTGFSPFALMFGRQARLPVDIQIGITPSPATTIPRYVDRLHKSLDFSYACVRERMGHQLQKQKTRYDTRTHGHPFKVGDTVWLHNPAVPRGRSKKLHRPWGGPYRVVARVSETVYRLQHLQRPRCKPIVHFDRLKRCPGDIRLAPESSPARGRAPAAQGEGVVQSHRPIGSGIELLEEDAQTPEVGPRISLAPHGDGSPVDSSPSATSNESTERVD